MNVKHKDPDCMPAALSNYINTEIGLTRGTTHELYHTKVKKIVNDESDNPVVVATNNTVTNSRRSGAELLDGTT